MARTSADYLVLDIETVTDMARWTPPVGQEGAFPPSWAQRVVAVGCMWLDHRYRLREAVVFVERAGASPDGGERGLLAAWSEQVGAAKPILVTYNGRRFDLPVLALRALCHGVPMPWYYREPSLRRRYSEDGHLDLCEALSDHGAARFASLDALAKLVGLPGKLGIDGSQVGELYARGERRAIASYCLADVAQTALLLLRYRVLQGRLPLEAYRAAARELIAALAADGRLADVVAGIDLGQLLVAAADAQPA